MSTTKQVSNLIERVVSKKLTPKQAIREAVSLTEATATYFIPDQDKLNRTVLRFKRAFPDSSEPKVVQHGSGYAVTFAVPGGSGMGQLATFVAGLGGSYQLPGFSGGGAEKGAFSDFSGF